MSTSQGSATHNATQPTVNKSGAFVRPASSFRDVIEKGGKFAPEKGRYHLYINYGCPWANRTLIVRKLKGLEEIIDVTVLSPRQYPEGWAFGDIDDFPLTEKDPLFGAQRLSEIYFKAEPNYTGRYTVPLLWDKKTNTIVNNESSEIIRTFNTAFNELLPADKAALDLYPEHLRTEIDALNDWVYETVNNGVYRAGFASSQEAYEEAVIKLFTSLDRLEKILQGKDYLVGGVLTEADVRLFTTIVRFDAAYFTNFKCNIRTIRDGYPAIHLWLRKLYWNNSAFKDSTFFDHIKKGYYDMAGLNPSRIVAVGMVPHILPLA
ncbi:S-glutathionyl-(chloro)hydroquinone reductase [Steccherinum ochraceum]|uniref:S-glutathionyl-(Chloro)hydroquinone reductase n=1 Tax=Steccherinum ochraceum TaxID=92696 RepID=A0A4R0R1H3_9APHY|nr:S-glutathionyl-(chloro)hydroquinone reductase [Steccherinum ochraceum]